MLATTACRTESPQARAFAPRTIPEATPRPRHTTPRTFVIGHSVQGRPIEYQEFGRGSDVILIIATIHGDEAAGTPLVRRLAHFLASDTRLLNRIRVVVVPNANPDGFAGNQRHNANGVDLNRNFPADNFSADDQRGHAPLSEPESRAIYELINRYHPKCIVSLHQPLACIDYDGPGERIARIMSAHCGLPVRKLGGRPGSLGSYAGITRNIPIITFELPRSADRLDDATLWAQYGPALIALFRSHQ